MLSVYFSRTFFTVAEDSSTNISKLCRGVRWPQLSMDCQTHPVTALQGFDTSQSKGLEPVNTIAVLFVYLQ